MDRWSQKKSSSVSHLCHGLGAHGYPHLRNVRREPPHLLLSLGIAKQRPDANSICSLRNKSIGTWWSNGTWQTCKISMDMQIFPWYLVYFWKLANSHCKYHPSQIVPAFTCFETQISTHGNWTMTYYDPLRPSCEGATYNFRDCWSFDPRIPPLKTLLLHFSNLMPADPVSPDHVTPFLRWWLEWFLLVMANFPCFPQAFNGFSPFHFRSVSWGCIPGIASDLEQQPHPTYNCWHIYIMYTCIHIYILCMYIKIYYVCIYIKYMIHIYIYYVYIYIYILCIYIIIYYVYIYIYILCIYIYIYIMYVYIMYVYMYTMYI